MPVTTSWLDFYNNNLRPALNDNHSSALDPSRINSLTLFVISDLQAKGLTDITTTLASGAITSISANHADAWNLIALGIKYYYVNDPVVKIDSAAGTSITKDEDLVNKAQAEYFLNLQAYLTVHKLATKTALEFWTEYLEANKGALTPGGAGNSNGNLTLDDRLALLAQENIYKLQQIELEADRKLDLNQQNFVNKIEELELKRRYQLEDRAAKETKDATNGAWTASGQVTITYLTDYAAPLEDTVTVDKKGLDLSFFGLPTLVGIGTVESTPILVSAYKQLNVQLVATQNVTFVLKELIGNTWVDVGTPATDNAIIKTYSLLQTNIIKLVISSTNVGTQLYLSADLLGV